MAKITKIPATINPLTHAPKDSPRKRRVAGYARVSTDSDEQFTSYEAQVDYYTNYIKSKPEWEFVKVYTDEGISGCNTKYRTGFKEMIADAMDGRIDLIVTKSVSRFARNTVDSLTTIRQLKEKGVECYFEKENIYTFDGKGELLITIMSSLAQEESRSISENITWGQRKRFSDGKVSMPYKRFLGYRKGPDGRPEVVEDEAVVVRLIYRLFLEGRGATAICHYLEELGIPSPGGKEKWTNTTVRSILQNEKYKGDALLQKRFTVDYLQKKQKKNTGEVPQYYVEDSHEGIIDKDEWALVQEEFARRRTVKQYHGKDAFSSKLICEDCGCCFGSKTWHSNDKYRHTVWQCDNKYRANKRCRTPAVNRETIHELFLKAYNQISKNRAQVIADCKLMRKSLVDFSDLDAKIAEQTAEIQTVSELVEELVRENASSPQAQEQYLQKYGVLAQRYKTAAAELERLKEERESRSRQDKAIAQFIRTLQKQPEYLDTWDETLWSLALEKAIVHRNCEMTFIFYNGSEIRVGK